MSDKLIAGISDHTYTYKYNIDNLQVGYTSQNFHQR